MLIHANWDWFVRDSLANIHILTKKKKDQICSKIIFTMENGTDAAVGSTTAAPN
jgi:hypothetical protein